MRKRIIYFFLMLLLLIPLTSCFSLPSGDKKNDNDDKSDVIPALEIKTDDLLKEVVKDTVTWYELDLYIGDTYNLDIKLKDYDGDDYSIVYIFNYEDDYTDSVYLDGNILKTKDNAKDNDRANLKIEVVKKNTTKALETKNIFIELHERKASLELTTNVENVSIKPIDYLDYNYAIYIPMAGKYYQMPEAKYTNYDGEYSITYSIDEEVNNVQLKYDEDTLYFYVDPESQNLTYSIKEIYFNVLDKNNELINKYIARIYFTYEDPDVFQVYYGNNKELVHDGDTIYVEKNSVKIPVLPYYNNVRINTAQQYFTIDISDENIISKDKNSTIFGYNHTINPKSLGTTKVTFTYSKDTDNERKISITVCVFDGKVLESIYVPNGKDAFSIVGNNVYVNGKIYAIYEVGNPESINGSDDLNIVLSDTLDENVKRITLTYTYKGVTKNVSYDINALETNTYEKTNIDKNYYDYWDNLGYKVTPSLGEAKVLAIPIWFTDSNKFISDVTKDGNGKTQKEQIVEDLDKALFGNNDEVSFRSLRTYYLEESFGSSKISGNVTPWYVANKKSTDYPDKDESITDLVSDAIKWYFDESGTTEVRSDYDANNDGKIDYVFAFYGANYHVIIDDTPRTRSWCWKVRGAKEDTLQVYGWVSALDIYGLSGVKEREAQLEISDLSTRMGLYTKTIIHEFAHGLGIYDLYDTKNMSYFPTDEFNMQSTDRGGHDPYDVMAIGYADPYVFASNDTSLPNEITIQIKDFQSSGDLILLTPNWDNDKQIFDEYLLLELYTPTGLNLYDANSNTNANCVGIRLWHVNTIINSSTKRHTYTNTSDTTNDLVHFIRDDKEHTLREKTVLKEEYLFQKGESFNIEDYSLQFTNGNKLDNGLSLGWSFIVLDIVTDEYGNATATIKLTKTL